MKWILKVVNCNIKRFTTSMSVLLCNTVVRLVLKKAIIVVIYILSKNFWSRLFKRNYLGDILRVYDFLRQFGRTKNA